MSVRSLCFSLAVIVALLASVSHAQLQFTGLTPVIKIPQGLIQGLSLVNGNAYMGIPFAQQPVGALRWQPPQPPLPFPSGVFNATSFGPACPQKCDLPPMTCPFDGYDEGCLTLVVYTPLGAAPAPGWPVMLFYYGGDYVQGGAGVTLYSGLQMVNQSGVVLVVINYRLGALGFLHTHELQGNYAVMDQTQALRWVQSSITAFGGNPDSVTIFGQSAGAMSVTSQMQSPAARGLFHAAIIESNPIGLGWSTEENALLMANKFAAALNCQVNDTACMRAASIADVLEAQGKSYRIPIDGPLQIFIPWLPYADGTIIPDQPLAGYAKGNYNPVPVIMGTVQDEGVLFIYSGFPRPVTLTQYEEILVLVFKQHAAQVYSMYPCTTPDDCRPIMSDLGTAYIFACPVRNATRSQQLRQPSTYLYHFDHLINADNNHSNIWGPDYTECQYEICHASELPFVFGSMQNQPSPYKWGPGEAQFSLSMSAYWGNMAVSHTPNSPVKVPTSWPAYTPQDDTVIRMYYDDVVNFPLEKGYLEAQCNFFDRIGYHWGTFN